MHFSNCLLTIFSTLNTAFSPSSDITFPRNRFAKSIQNHKPWNLLPAADSTSCVTCQVGTPKSYKGKRAVPTTFLSKLPPIFTLYPLSSSAIPGALASTPSPSSTKSLQLFLVHLVTLALSLSPLWYLSLLSGIPPFCLGQPEPETETESNGTPAAKEVVAGAILFDYRTVFTCTRGRRKAMYTAAAFVRSVFLQCLQCVIVWTVPVDLWMCWSNIFYLSGKRKLSQDASFEWVFTCRQTVAMFANWFLHDGVAWH